MSLIRAINMLLSMSCDQSLYVVNSVAI